MSRLALYLLGTPRLELDGVVVTIDRRKVLAVLVYLALTQRTHRRDHLAALFWPSYSQTTARANLRRTLSLLKHTVTSDWLQADRENVTLVRSGDYWLDVDQFHRLVTACTGHGHRSHEVCPDCLEPLTQAVALHRDDLMVGFTLSDCPEFDDWQLFQTESLRRELAEALEKLVRGYSAQNEFEPAIRCARRWLALDPLEELAHRHLMRLLTLTDRRNAALAQYDTCRQLLADQLGVEPTEETTALVQQIRQGKLVAEGPAPAVSLHPSTAPRHNLPAQLTPFVGRAEELAHMARLLGDEPACRLLTLVGPGGIGKTRLAMQAAKDNIDAFSHGICFVSLASIGAVEAMAPAIAEALNLPVSQGSLERQLISYLREKQLLLVLDNFEHLISQGGIDLLAEIAFRAPQVKLLVTSRERLNVQEEWGVEVTGMSYPTGTKANETELEAYEAVQLFVQRAYRARPDFELSERNSQDVVRICQLAEGMPLGLELAAAWLRMMSCSEIAQEMERHLDFLTTSLRDVPERHQSLRIVFEQSWRLLREEEKAVFRKLSVFRGGFRRRAAERVAGASLPVLSALVDKSLLRRARTGRYDIHELLRQYAGEQLALCPEELAQVRDRHADYYLTFFLRRAEEIKGKQAPQAFEEISADIDNVRAGWQRAITRDSFIILGRAADGLLLFGESRGWFREGRDVVQQARQRLTMKLEQGEVGEKKAQFDLVLAQLFKAEGWFSVRLGDMDKGQELLEDSIDLLRQAEPGSEGGLALALYWVANQYWLRGRYGETKQYAQESLALFTQLDDRWGMAMTLHALGWLAVYQGEYWEADRIFRECIGYLEGTGELLFTSESRNSLGVLARLWGEYARASHILENGLHTKRNSGDLHGSAYNLRELGYLAIAMGNYAQAKECLKESATIFKELDSRYALVFPIDGLGTVARLQGEYQRSELYHRESLRMCQELEERRGIALCLHNLGVLAYDRQDLGEAERLLQESLVRYRQIGHRNGTASALCYLGYVTSALGRERRREARRRLQEGLEIAAEIGARPVILNGLLGWAMWLAGSGSGVSTQEQALELLAVALHHPASEQETRDRAQRLWGKLASSLPPDAVLAAEKRGKARALDTALRELPHT